MDQYLFLMKLQNPYKYELLILNMGLFRRREKVVDWTERLTRQKESENRLRQSIRENAEAQQQPPQKESSGGSFFSFFGNSTPSNSSTNTEANSSYSDGGDEEERRRKLAKRLADITTRLEDLSNSIYKIEQRLELIERKISVNRY